MNPSDIIRALPKLEQHIHIIGSTQPETLLWLIQDSGVKSDLKTLEDVKKHYRFTDFSHFIRVYSSVNDIVTKESQYELITYEMLQNEAKNNVRHVEAIWSAYDHMRRGLDYIKMLDSINAGIRRASRDFGVTCTIRVDLVRNYGPEIGAMLLERIKEKGDNIVAVDIGGSENGYPPEPYEAVFRRAREQGLHLVAHAGEAAGPESVWGAVECLKVERIGHGVAATRDKATIQLLKSRNVTIECCPISNLRTGAIKSIKEHPIREFIQNGLKVSLNSDDPPMFGTDMNNEYLMLNKELDFTPRELANISLNAVDTAFLPEVSKRELHEIFVGELQRLKL
ncbi:MAG: adenosine deaminase [Candidatus Bathyarchaeota archaeon]|nr:adenosine deaminase [Candidatus Bathyarchaeota archaeon]